MQKQNLTPRKKLPKRTLAACIILLLGIPLTLVAGVLLSNDTNYYLISLIILVLAMLPFVLVFESRRPSARELVMLAVLVAIAVAGRAVFFMLPQVKPLAAIVIIAAACFGAEAGFVVGSMAGFLSNFMFGQGPWTPWQMFAYGLVGFVAGLLFQKGILPKSRIPLTIYGAASILLLFGPLLDISSLLMFTPDPTPAAIFAYLLAGMPFNLTHAASTAAFLLLIGPAMIQKLERIKQKYGMLEA